jgi:hypothetical protein
MPMFKIIQIHSGGQTRPSSFSDVLRRFWLMLLIAPLVLLAAVLLVLGFFAVVILIAAAVVILPLWAWFRRRKWSRANDGRQNVRVVSRLPGQPWQDGM